MNNKATLELGTKPVGALLWQYAMPAIVAMIASSMYNIVDSVFIGQGVGALAIAGLAVTFPFMNLSTAFGAAIGIGASTLISVRLGQRDYKAATQLLGQTISLNVVVGALFAIVSLLFIDPILRFFGASDQTLPYAREYMVVILLGNIITHLYFGSNGVLRAVGKPRIAMYTTIMTVVLNALLDPLFIYVFRLGIAGAAYATVLSQVVALVWQMRVFSDRQELVHLQRGIYRLRSKIVKNIIGIGMSPFAINATACIVVIFINQQLVAYGGDMAVGAYGIANRLGFVCVMIVFGINQGMQPIAGYNYGAGNYPRLMGVLRLAMLSATALSILGWAVFVFCPEACVSLFTTDAELKRQAAHTLTMWMLVFPVVGYQIVITNFFQSIGKAKISMLLSLSRQLLVLIPLIVVLPLWLGLEGVLWAIPCSDLTSAMLAAVIMQRNIKKIRLAMEAAKQGPERPDMSDNPHTNG